MFLRVLHHLNTAGSTLQRIPNRQQTSFTIFPPLMIPKAKFPNVLILEERASFLVLLYLLRQAVLETVKLDGQTGRRAIEIQKVNSGRMLAAKFEPGETMASQRAPELLFFIGLVATKLAGGLD